MPLLKRMVLRTAALLSPRSRRLHLTDAHNGLRVFNKTVADGLNITMNGMSHASEFITLIAENHWRVAEEPVEISTPNTRCQGPAAAQRGEHHLRRVPARRMPR